MQGVDRNGFMIYSLPTEIKQTLTDCLIKILVINIIGSLLAIVASLIHLGYRERIAPPPEQRTQEDQDKINEAMGLVFGTFLFASFSITASCAMDI